MARVLKGPHSITCTRRVHPLTEWKLPAFACCIEPLITYLHSLLRYGLRPFYEDRRLLLVAQGGNVRQQHRRRQSVDRPLRPYDNHQPQKQRLLRTDTAGKDATGCYGLDVMSTTWNYLWNVYLRWHITAHGRSQDFVWGALFSWKKLTTFLLVALKRRPKTAKSTTSVTSTFQISKSVPIMDSSSAWGWTWCAGVHVQIFPANYA